MTVSGQNLGALPSRQKYPQLRKDYTRSESYRLVPVDEIATAIARCAGCLADSVVTGERIDRGEGRAIHYGGSNQIFFDRSA